MKVNEAPEKLYFGTQPNTVNHFFGLTQKCADDDIEYIRKDAFIEKAVKYLYNYNQNMVKKHGAKALLGCSEFTINVNEFRKYMKGE